MTTTTAEKKQNLLVPSATYPEVEAIEEALLRSDAVRWMDFAIKTKHPVQFISDPGNGKTSFVKGYAAAKGLKVWHAHCPTLDMDQLSVPIPQDTADGSDKVLQPSVLNDVLEADLILLDETRRAKDSVRNAVMEMLQEKSIGGVPLKEGVSFIVANNWASESGVMSAGVDLAQESRYITIELKDRDLPWQVALGATFADTDLTDVFDTYNTLERDFPGVSKYLSPRTLEHILWNILNDLPGELGLPLMAGPREWLRNDAGDNVTDEVMARFAAAVGKPFRKSQPGVAREAILKAIDAGVNVMVQGDPGIGKTSWITSVLREKNINSLYWSLQNVSPDEHVVPFPGKNNRLDFMLSQVVKPLDGAEYVLVGDEFYRAKPAVLNMMLEMTQGATLGGQDIPLRSVVAMTNPREVNGMKMKVNKPDRAMADRFFVSVDVTEGDIPANEYLMEKYGDIASPFIEWWKEDIDNAGRTLITKRTLEKMIMVFQEFSDPDELEKVKPYMKDEYVPVPLHDLKLRLSKRPVARLKAILEKKDEYVERLAAKAADGGAADQQAHIQVYQAISRAENSEVEKAHDDLVELVAYMDSAHKTSLLRNLSKDQQKTRSKLVIAAKRHAKSLGL